MSSDDNKTSESASGNRTDPTDGFVDDTDSLSEDERDLILAQLYHSSATISTSKPNTLPREKQTNGLSENKGKIGIDDAEGDIPPTTAGTLSKTKRKMTFGEYLDSQAAVPSTKFTFELDLDNLPPPPKPTTVDEVPSFDEEEDDDEEFAVVLPPPHLTIVPCSRSLFCSSSIQRSVPNSNNLLPLQPTWSRQSELYSPRLS